MDLARSFGRWEHATELAEKADIILACRPEECGNDAFKNRPTEKYAVEDDAFDISHYRHVTLQNPQIVLSSTDIRARIAGGESWRYLVNDGVFHYIVEHKLYGYRTV
jgi:nicotinate-nucleotide adenylyltransferase